MTVARFIAGQRTFHAVPHAACCRLLGVSESWFYKWAARDGALTVSETRRRQLDDAVAVAFEAAKGKHGSPRLVADLREAPWTVSEKTVAASVRRQGLVARRIRRRRNTTRPDKTRKPFPDLLRRDFAARGPNLRGVGDTTEIPVATGTGSSTSRPGSTCTHGAAWRRAPARARTPRWRARRSRPRSRRAADRVLSATSSSTPTADRPTPPSDSQPCAGNSRSHSRWAVSAPSITPPPRRSSPPWNGRSYATPSSASSSTPRPSSRSGARGSTTTSAATAITFNSAASTSRR